MSTAMTTQGLTPEQVDLITRTIAVGATPDELALFIGQCDRTGLDPFSKQIYAIKRWDGNQKREVMAVQVGIDGFRLIAERTGRYAGQLGPHWSDGKLYPVYNEAGQEVGQDLRWLDAWPYDEPPRVARVGALRANTPQPFWGVARYGAYVQTKKDGNPNAFWWRMPDVMLAKCAESLALRKAFPHELSGLYTPEEMGEPEDAEVVHRPPTHNAPRLAAPANGTHQPAPTQRAAALPANGRELQMRLYDYDKKLAAQRQIRAGDLVKFIVEAGKKAGYEPDLATWEGPAIAFAVEQTKAFEASLAAQQQPQEKRDVQVLGALGYPLTPAAERVTGPQLGQLNQLISDAGVDPEAWCHYYRVNDSDELPAAKFDGASKKLRTTIEHNRRGEPAETR